MYRHDHRLRPSRAWSTRRRAAACGSSAERAQPQAIATIHGRRRLARDVAMWMDVRQCDHGSSGRGLSGKFGAAFRSPDALCPSIRSRSFAALGILPRDILQLRRATAAASGRSGHRLWISGANAAELVLFGVHGFPAGPISPGSGPAAQHGDRGRRALVGRCNKFLGAAAARMYQSATCMCLEGRLAGL